jgi:hypothetical protein
MNISLPLIELATPLIETEVEKYQNLGTHKPRPLVFRKKKNFHLYIEIK